MATTKRIVLITGATSGVGYGLAAQLLKRGTYHVLLGARSQSKGMSAVKDLQSLSDEVEMIPIDVTNDESIDKAVATVDATHGRVDIIVNNAGTAVMDLPLRQAMVEAFNVNAVGPAAVVKAFSPLLQKSSMSSPRPAIINVSSGAGSISRCLDSSSALYGQLVPAYRSTKAALNMVTACQWVEFGPAIRVFAYDPGFTVSNLSSHNKLENGARSAEDSASSMVDVIEGKRDDEVGMFLHNTGQYPW